MTREIVLDTETTGLDPASGDRIVELGALELDNHVPTGRTFHEYLDPERDMPAEAEAVHGLSADFLRGKPKFAEVADRFIAFLGDAQLVIHNAEFDMKFLNAEFDRAGRPALPRSRAVDTLAIARKRFPGAPANLDALCRRFGIDNGGRELHGALLDSELLAEVYLELIGGRQPGLVLAKAGVQAAGSAGGSAWTPPPRPAPLPPRLTEDEKAAHAAFIDDLGDAALWKRNA
ncbi:MAG: DNA polymerase III subunit epsilon [Pseudomonadota bacterium]